LTARNRTRAVAHVTARRDLRSGVPVWLRRGGVHVALCPLRKHTKVDVAVVGAGVTGALVVDALLEAGKTVAVLDRRGPGKGSTSASTAMLMFELDTPLTHLTGALGRQRAARAYWRSTGGVEQLRRRIADLGLRCGFQERKTVYLPGNVLGVRALKAEARARAAIGLPSRFIERDELRALTNIEGPGAILSSGSGEVDPVALVAGLWRSAIARGASIYAPVDVVHVDNRRSSVVLTTSDGREVQARHAVFATGHEYLEFIRPKKHKIVSTWAMATAPEPARLWPSRCLIWEAADPYLYFRTTLDGRIVAGGEDEDFSDEHKRDALIPAKIKAIRKKLQKLLPHVDTKPEFSWAACFGTSSTGLPSIGAVPGAKRCFAVLGYGGNGITFSTVAAQLIQRAVVGLRDPDEDLFAFES
jgi:glycine/D-amino acid oxidase-like deaminating enzyme